MARQFESGGFGKELLSIKRFGKDDGSYKILELQQGDDALYLVISIGVKGGERARGVFKLTVSEVLELSKVLMESATYMVRKRFK